MSFCREWYLKNRNDTRTLIEEGFIKREPSSGIGGGKSAAEWIQETNQLSGLSDYELELEKIVDKIKKEPNTLRCIQLLKKLVGDFGD